MELGLFLTCFVRMLMFYRSQSLLIALVFFFIPPLGIAEHKLKTFLDFCQDPSILPAEQLTVTSLVTISGAANGNCQSAFDALQKQTSIQLMPGEFDSLEPLRGLDKIRSLYLENKLSHRIFPSLALPNLKSLRILGLEFEDLTAMGDFSQLRELTISKINKTSLTFLGKLKHLEKLELIDGELDSIDFLSAIPEPERLRLLSVRNNRLSSLGPISRFQNLKEIQIQGNKIADLSPLRSLQKLETIWANDNEIVDLMPLKGNSRLKWLYIENNKIKSVEVIRTLSNLREVWILKNPLQDSGNLKKSGKLISIK